MPGGGVALLYASKILDGAKGGLNFDQKIGVDIVERALRVPLKTIANNAGAQRWQSQFCGPFSSVRSPSHVPLKTPSSAMPVRHPGSLMADS